MVKIFIAVLLFLLSLTLAALDPSAFRAYMDQKDIKLAQGIKYEPKALLWNFSDKASSTNRLEIMPNIYTPIEPDSYINPYATWYSDDFAEDPFDGRIEIAVIGEPLPSARVTLLITLITAGIIMWNSPKLHKT